MNTSNDNRSSRSDTYTVDFGSHDLNQEVIPTLFPKILENLGKALSKTQSQQDLQALLQVANVLIETQLEQRLSTLSQNEVYSCDLYAGQQTCIHPENEVLVEQSKTMADGRPADFDISSNNKKLAEGCNQLTKPWRTIYNPCNRLREIFTIALIIIVCFVTFTGMAYASCILIEFVNKAANDIMAACFMSSGNDSGISRHNVKSYQEYNDIITNSKHNERISVAINIQSFTDWPADVGILSSPMVVELVISGLFHATKLVTLLQKTKNLRKLSLDNVDNKLCSESLLASPLLKLEKFEGNIGRLEFSNFNSNCGTLFNTIKNYVSFGNLEEISFKNGNITGNNSVIQHLLATSESSLVHIEFTKCLSNVDVFSSGGVFRKVTSLVLDITWQGHLASTDMTRNIGEMFPNVEALSFGYQCKTLKEVEHLYSLELLKSLRIGIVMEPDARSFDIAFVGLRFQKLITAELAFQFSNCENNLNPRVIQGFYTLPQRLQSNVRLKCNCLFTKK